MTQDAHRLQRSGLSTRILVFVFCASFVTAMVVSGVALQGLHNALDRSAQVRLREAAGAGSEALAALVAGQSETPLGEDLHERIEARLSALRPEGVARMLLVDAEGRVLAGATRFNTETVPEELPPEAWSEGRRRPPSYRDASGEWMVSALRNVGDNGWRVAAETPFAEIQAAVFENFTRLFVLDVGLVLLVSFLGYRVTSAALRPIERLSDAARRIAQGQFDHEIPEPATHDEIGLLARTFNDMMRRLRGYQSEIEAANKSLTERNNELKQAKETFEQLSITDGLTKLHNHRFFQDHLTREIKRVARSGEPLSMLLADIDDFKRLNDRFGHAAGDELLMGLARIMNETVREADLLARYGGEEFVVLAANTDLEGAYRLAEKIRTNVAETSFILDDSLRPTRATVSIGVALYADNRKSFFRAADRALYRAKAEGKNCVVVATAEE